MKIHHLFLFFLIFTVSFLKAQLFTVIDPVSANLSTADGQVYQNLMAWGKTRSVQIVETGAIPDLQEHGILTFDIPGYSISSLKAEAVRVTYNNDNDYIWSGKITGGTTGYLSVIRKPEGTGGFIQTTDRSYLLTPFAETYSLLTKTAEAGTKQVGFNANDLPPGVYFCKIQIGATNMFKKLVVLK